MKKSDFELMIGELLTELKLSRILRPQQLHQCNNLFEGIITEANTATAYSNNVDLLLNSKKFPEFVKKYSALRTEVLSYHGVDKNLFNQLDQLLGADLSVANRSAPVRRSSASIFKRISSNASIGVAVVEESVPNQNQMNAYFTSLNEILMNKALLEKLNKKGRFGGGKVVKFENSQYRISNDLAKVFNLLSAYQALAKSNSASNPVDAKECFSILKEIYSTSKKWLENKAEKRIPQINFSGSKSADDRANIIIEFSKSDNIPRSDRLTEAHLLHANFYRFLQPLFEVDKKLRYDPVEVTPSPGKARVITVGGLRAIIPADPQRSDRSAPKVEVGSPIDEEPNNNPPRRPTRKT